MSIFFSRAVFSLFILLLCAGCNRVLANAAQPGIWNAGGTVFTMMFPEDSLSFRKVQMQEERIYIQLYKGYAVVKGRYLFRNTTNERLQFKMGYPVNGIYHGGEVNLNEIIIDSLSHFKISADGIWLPLLKESHPELNHDHQNTVPFGNNWMVWDMTFAPASLQTVEVYFIVNTNDARVRNGYNVEKRNAFIYLLESGSVWHQPIEYGRFYIQLMDDLTGNSIHGLSAGFGFRYNEAERLFAGTKSGFSPTPKDNLVVTYYQHNGTFNFEKVISRPENLFTRIDSMSRLPLETLAFSNITAGDPYAVKNSISGKATGRVFFLSLYAPYIIGVIVLCMIIWTIIKRKQIKKLQ